MSITARTLLYFGGSLLAPLGLLLSTQIGATSSTRNPAAQQASPEPTRSTRPAVPTTAPASASEPLSREAIAELMRIRQQQGSPLDGTIFDTVPNENGDATHSDSADHPPSLEGVTGSDPSRGVLPPQPSGESEFQAIIERLQVEQAEESPPVDTRPSEVPLPSFSAEPFDSPESPLVTHLRDAGRELDLEANRLEEAKQYDRADWLRELAHQLRRVARRYASPSP